MAPLCGGSSQFHPFVVYSLHFNDNVYRIMTGLFAWMSLPALCLQINDSGLFVWMSLTAPCLGINDWFVCLDEFDCSMFTD